MQEAEQIDALARLLSSRELRDSFRRAPREVCAELGIGEAAQSLLLSIENGSLETQAELLLRKRFHEVRQLIPRTVAALGVRARRAFFDYAESHWPSGHQRHVVDALNFCRGLKSRGMRCVSRAEFNRLLFITSSRRFRIHAVSDLIVEGRSRIAVQVLMRGRSGRVRERFYYTAAPLTPSRGGEKL